MVVKELISDRNFVKILLIVLIAISIYSFAPHWIKADVASLKTEDLFTNLRYLIGGPSDMASEITVISILGVRLFDRLGTILFGAAQDFWRAAFAPFLVFIALIMLVTAVGIGVATRNPKRFAFGVSYLLLPFYVIFKDPKFGLEFLKNL